VLGQHVCARGHSSVRPNLATPRPACS
jgi:hypothetical protein